MYLSFYYFNVNSIEGDRFYNLMVDDLSYKIQYSIFPVFVTVKLLFFNVHTAFTLEYLVYVSVSATLLTY